MQILILPVLVDWPLKTLHRLNIHEWKKTYFVDNMKAVTTLTSDRNKKAEIALESVLMCKC